MQCPLCFGKPPLYEATNETSHTVITYLWFAVADVGPLPEGVEVFDFDGAPSVLLALTFREKRKGGAVLTAHYCLTEGDHVYTLKGRIPLNEPERAALFGFMRDSFRIEETRGRKPKVPIGWIREFLRRMPQASIRRVASEFGVDPQTIRRTYKAEGTTHTEEQRKARAR